jgi:hypothetical protein
MKKKGDEDDNDNDSNVSPGFWEEKNRGAAI